jgi:hypothetical protein
MKPYQIRTTRLTVIPTGEPIFSEMATHIEIDDESAGEFLRITQQSGCLDAKAQSIAITPEEWPHVRHAVETMIEGIHSWENDDVEMPQERKTNDK